MKRHFDIIAILICFAMALSTCTAAGAERERALPESTGQTVSCDPEAPKYDPRTDGNGVSPIRDQFWGTCWAQSGIATAEMSLIHRGLEDSSYQLSVEDLLWWAKDEEDGGWLLPTRNDSAYPPAQCGFLTTEGVRLESDVPYLGEPSDGNKERSEVYGKGENKRPEKYYTAPLQYEITDMIYAKSPDIEQAKKLISEYGAVGASYYANMDGFNEKTAAAWMPYDEKGSNHAITVVGWDDTFPKENFNKIDGEKPEHDGAWIIKNSYGEDFGSDGGYNYISYEDGYLFKEEEELGYVYCISGIRKPVRQNRYLNDQYGAIRSIRKTEPGTAVWANVFDFGANEKLSELSFVSWAEGSDYEMYYAPFDGKAPSADESEWKLLADGKIPYAGYTTVKSSWDEEVPSGKGAILFKVTGDTQSVGTDEPGYADNGRMKFNPVSDEGTAFELKNGKFVRAEVQRTANGFSYTETPDLSIRAYTVPAEGDTTSIEKAEIAAHSTIYTYDKAAHKPLIRRIAGKTLREGRDYDTAIKNSKGSIVKSAVAAGVYILTVTGKDLYTGTAEIRFTIKKHANTLKIKAGHPEIRYKKLAKRAQTLAAYRVITLTNKGQGARSYKVQSVKKGRKSFKKYFVIDKATGRMTVKKGLKKGTYKAELKVRASGNNNYKASEIKTVTVKVRVR